MHKLCFSNDAFQAAYYNEHVYIRTWSDNYAIPANSSCIAKCYKSGNVKIIELEDSRFQGCFVVNNQGIWRQNHNTIGVFDEQGKLKKEFILDKKNHEVIDTYIYDDKLYALYEHNNYEDYKIIQYNLNGEAKELLNTKNLENTLYQIGLKKTEQSRKEDCEYWEKKYKPLSKSAVKVKTRNKFNNMIMANSTQVIFSFYMQYDLAEYDLSHHVVLRINPDNGECECLEFGDGEILRFDMLNNDMWFRIREECGLSTATYKTKIQPIEQAKKTALSMDFCYSCETNDYYDGTYMFHHVGHPFYACNKNKENEKREWSYCVDGYRVLGDYLYINGIDFGKFRNFNLIPKSFELPDESEWWVIPEESIVNAFEEYIRLKDNTEVTSVNDKITDNSCNYSDNSQETEETFDEDNDWGWDEKWQETEEKNFDSDDNWGWETDWQETKAENANEINVTYNSNDHLPKTEETISCKNCKTKLPIHFKFCMECGNPVKLICKNCGVELPHNAKFCMECGTKV